jgi:hypothetical protein
MTTDQFIAKQHSKIAKLKTGEVIGIAAQDTHVKMVERIFEEGKTSAGAKLKYNSTDPLYVNPNTQSPKKFTTMGKPKEGRKRGDSKFKDGTPHKTGYFDSYMDFRAKIGRETSFMNLDLFGILKSDFGKGVIKLSPVSWISTVTNEANKGKLESFNVFFQLNKDERGNFKEVLRDESMKILKEDLR